MIRPLAPESGRIRTLSFPPKVEEDLHLATRAPNHTQSSGRSYCYLHCKWQPEYHYSLDGRLFFVQPNSMTSPLDAFLVAPWRTTLLSASDKSKVAMQRSGGSHFSECDDRIQLSVDVPGVKAKELAVKVENGVLTISGTRKITLENQQGCKRYRFEKNFSIDADSIDIAHLTANLYNGVLMLRAPKMKRKRPLYIEITEDPEVEDDEVDDDTTCTPVADNTSKSDAKMPNEPAAAKDSADDEAKMQDQI